MTYLRVLWYLHKMRKYQWLKRSEIEAIQRRKLRALLRHTYENVEFYHRRLRAAGVKPDDIKTINDLRKLPFTTRKDVQRNFEKIVAKNVPLETLTVHTSSGSSGVPVRVASDRKARDYRAATFVRPFFECGLKLTDKMMHIATHKANKHAFEKFGLMRKTCVLSKEPVQSSLKLLGKYKPNAIHGHSAYVYLLARLLVQAKPDYRLPRLAFTTGELLTRNFRKTINNAFGVEPFDIYGCTEVERVGWECPERVGYHLNTDGLVIEFIDDNEHVAEGEKGEVVLTCLYNYAMPLIRYKIEDIGTPSSELCSCGRNLPLMKRLEGRANDFIKLPNGELIPPMVFTGIDEITGIEQFRVIQTRKEIRVELVKGTAFSTQTITEVRSKIGSIVGKNVLVVPEVVDEIPLETSGKFCVVKSLVTRLDDFKR